MFPPLDAQHIQSLAPRQALQALRSTSSGLRHDEVQRRRAEFGFNELSAARGRRWPGMLARQFCHFFSLLLIFSAVLCFVADWLRPDESMPILGGALAGVALLNGLFAFAQEYRAERAMEALRQLLPQQVCVRREGGVRQTPARELVPGDVLLVAAGDRVPADARLLEATGLQVSLAPLTGESRPVWLSADPVKDVSLGERSNLLLAGCSVLRGEGAAVVYAVGRNTQFGRIARLSVETHRPASPLERDVARLTRLLTLFAATMGLVFFGYGVLVGRPWLLNLVFMMGILVANVPEGLLPTLTLALSMGALRMARKRVLVKGLQAVETLGAMHIICTDKTGTLTADQLSLAGVYGCLASQPLHDAARRECLRWAMIASDLHESAAGHWIGDPLDAATAQQYAASGGDVAAIVRGTRRHIPFDARQRRQAGIYEQADGRFVAVKGAWEAIRPHTSRVQWADESASPTVVDPELLEQLDQQVERLARQGMRVLAVAYAQEQLGAPTPETASNGDGRASESPPENWSPPQLVVAGFLAWEDPVRPEVPEAIAQCRSAGIRVLMVTGDHPETATAVARQIGLVPADATAADAALLGEQLDRLSDEQIAQRVERGAAIFARTTPEQKLKIVVALKHHQAVVGMTGDGVNDAPALKAADVGIAMGVGGTEVAREAADVILLDNHFASIVAGVEEGRAIYRNIRRFTDYVLASNVPEIAPYLLYILFPIPLALTIVQILAIDLGTDILPAIGLGQEPPEADLMRQPPRRTTESLLDRETLWHAYFFYGPLEALVSLGLFFYVLCAGGWQFGDRLAPDDPLYRSAATMTLATVVLLQMGNLIGRRSSHGSGFDRGLLANRLLLLGLGLEIAFLGGILGWPPLQRVLATSTVPWEALAAALAATPVVFLIDYTVKRYRARNQQGAIHAR
ncbi:MAG: cation-transporting P-type ATPase [Pirellulales bacterium]